MTIKNFARSLLILIAGMLAAPGSVHAADPNVGPGGPILVITNGNQNFGKFYAEILRTEGFNEFAVAEIGAVTSTTLDSYDVVILAQVALTGSQVTMLTNWVNAGGNLLAMNPDAQLASLLGITPSGSSLPNGYLLINTATKIGAGSVNATIQYHGSAQLSSLAGATALATLYSNATTQTASPAITLRSVGANGGQAAAFMFDLATSIVYTRQGNPAWAGQERDGQTPRRSDDLFYGASASDPQLDWVDLNKVSIPQADEQQRFLANLILEMNADRKALPRFWYFPHNYRSALIMSGDDHGFFYVPDGGHTAARFDQYLAASPAGCSLDDWECVRGTSYIFTNSALTNAQAAAYQAQGFEIAPHFASLDAGGNCIDFTPASLSALYTDQKLAFYNKFTALTAATTQRHHCIVWSDWASTPKTQLANGIRLDTSYYFWPQEWVQNRPGHFTGSAMPMRFADTDGSLIDVYQAATQMTDESGQQFPFTAETLLDRAVGTDEQYGVYMMNAHIDVATERESDTSVAAAQERNVPVITAQQMLKWLDSRNASSFSALTRAANTLSFTVTQAAGANGLQAMLPWRSGNQVVSLIRRNGTDVTFELSIVKGIEYANFAAPSGNYVVTYVADSSAPTIVSRTPAPGATGVAVNGSIRIGFSETIDVATVNTQTFELRDPSDAVVPATITFVPGSQSVRITPNQELSSSTTYTVSVRGGASDPRVKDPAGNALAATSTYSFTTTVPGACPCSIWNAAATPAVTSENDTSSVELGLKFRADSNGFIRGIRFYKGAGNTGVHRGSLWSSTGTLLATATFQNETATGWQEVAFSAPVAITAGTVYVASYFAPNGGYATTGQQFQNAVDNGVLHALSSVEASGNGVYRYGSGGQMPTDSFDATNYWVDVVFDTSNGAPDTSAPVATIVTPANADTFSTSTTPIAIGGTANDNVGVTQVNWSNDRGGSGSAIGTTSWSIPSVALQTGVNLITITAVDGAGNVGTDTIAITYSAGPDTTPPTITARTPAISATGVSAAASVTVTFNEAMSAASISGSSFELRNPSNALITATVSYNSSTNTATLAPASALATNTTYTVNVKGGATAPRVTDVAGNALAATASWTFTTANTTTQSLWASSATPSVASESDPGAVELGVKFRSDVAGFVTGIRFYKGPSNGGVHTGTLWTSGGTALATATFQSETASGWQQATFSTPVQIAANTLYVASYFAPTGGYSYDVNYFATNGVDNGVLHAPNNATAGGNGVYLYSSGGQMPTQTFGSANYWVDVTFVTDTGPDTTPPTIQSRSPNSGAINVAANSPVTVTFSEAMAAASISASTIELRNASNVVIAATVSLAGNTATLAPTAALANSSTYTARVIGGTNGVKDAAGNALAATESWTFTTAASGGPCAANEITAENCLTGNPASEWDVVGAGDPSIQGFATQISVNRGTTVQFKVSTNSTNYRLDIYRMGYYGGLGARKIITVTPSATLPQTQDPCMTQASSGLIDCGNWNVSASWPVPSTAVSGIYFAKLVRADTGGSSHIFFIVRNDASTSDIVFQTSDTTWQAYNTYGGNSLYQGSPGTNPGRAYKVSYNRPFNTRGVDGGQDWVFNAEYPMVRWLEANGYSVSYITGVDADRSLSAITNHKTFISVGHDEYWSAQQRANVESARNAGVHLAFFSGNEVFWKTRWENSIDGSGTPYRTLVSYKETHANAKLDTSTSVWTGSWRDPRFSPPSDGGRPENGLTGTIFTVNAGTSSIKVPAAEGKMRLWRGTTVAGLGTTEVATMPNGTLGYEWDSDLDNGARPPGLIRLSDTTVNVPEKLQDYGSTYAAGTANHALTMYRHASGARVFGAGTVQWSWGLDANHDRAGTAVDQRMQQATVNLFADMNAQPSTLQSGLTAASMSTDFTAPTVAISFPTPGASLPQSPVTMTGTASDVGGVVAAIEVSTDGGTTWRPATGRTTWSFDWTPQSTGSVTLRVRGVDDSGNIQSTPTTVTVNVGAATCPCSLWPATTPSVSPDIDSNSVELGTRFRSTSAGSVTALRFWKDPQNTGTHVGSLWSSSGALLAQVTFANESASGWQVQNLTTPVTIQANTSYVVSYHTNAGAYTAPDGYFATAVSNGPLTAPQDGDGGANGFYQYSSSSTFPTQTYNSESYFVDIIFNPSGGGGDTTAPAVTITSPTSSDTTTVTTTPFALGGTASDAVGVTQVSWSNNRGGSGTASGTNSWSVSGIVLQAGANVLTVTARDAANNTSTDTLTVTYNAPDTTAPTVTITTPTSNATTTATSTPMSIGGTAADAVGVTQVTWVNNRGGSGTASGTSAWAVSGIVLLSGSNVLTVTARDAAGNTSTDTLTVTYSPDTTAPAVTITSPTSVSTLSTQSATLNLGGTSSDAVGVTQVTWANNRGGSGTASGTTNWSVAGIVLQTGSNVLTVTARDAAGNSSIDTLTVAYTPDTTTPVITITSPTNATTLTTTTNPLNLSGTASDAVGVTQVSWSNSRGGSGNASGTLSWSVSNIALQPGSNVLTVTARDAAGNTSVDTLTVTYNDTTLPAITITSPTSNSTLSTTASPLSIGGTASDNIAVTAVTWTNNRGGSGTASGTTAWTVSGIVLQSGSNTLTVTARDAAGNVRADTLTVTYTPDTTLPSITILTPTSGTTLTTSASSVTLGGTASDNIGVTQVSWTSSRGSSGNASGTTIWSSGSIPLLTGSNVLTVTARDAAGNVRTDALTVTRN